MIPGCSPCETYIDKNLSDEDILAPLAKLNLPISKQIKDFYLITRGRRWMGHDDVYVIWALDEITENYSTYNLPKDRFYFSDVLIWSFALYFQTQDNETSVYADYQQNGIALSAPSIDAFILKLGTDWDAAIYPKRSS